MDCSISATLHLGTHYEGINCLTPIQHGAVDTIGYPLYDAAGDVTRTYTYGPGIDEPLKGQSAAQTVRVVGRGSEVVYFLPL